MTETSDKVKILDTIRELAQELGHPPSRAEFQEITGVNGQKVLTHFSSWRDALRACGLESNPTNFKVEDKDLLEDWGLFVRKNRYIPTVRQFRHKGTYEPSTFQEHFGTWTAIPLKFKQYAQDKPEWVDILHLLPTDEPKFTKAVSFPKPTEVANPSKKIRRRSDISLGYVDPRRLNQLRGVTNDKFDLIKLIRLCEELNESYKDESYFAVAMLVRTILDHVPPIFGCNDFAQIASKHGGRSFKESMLHLDNSSRKIADRHLHSQIRKRENLPYGTQVNFASDLDVLLEEIVTILK